jgi:endogenous inhibitor of DNA gyrase (YacG/DUF329 family)
MTTIKCPICKNKVSGTTTMDLNESLRVHLADVHLMRELAPVQRESAYQEKSPYRQPVEREKYEMEKARRRYVERRPAVGMFDEPPSKIYRVVETWSNRDPERFESKNYIPREEVRQWRYPIVGPAGERGPAYVQQEPVLRREAYGEEQVRTTGQTVEEVNEINCPLCGARVRGRDEDELSDELKGHMAEIHDIRPRMMTTLRR